MRYTFAVAALVFVAACGGADGPPAADAGPDVDGNALVTDASPTADLDMQAADFECIKNGTKVNKFYVTNKLGQLAAALAVANSPTGGTYPVGTIVQLIPQEAMVKRRSGWNPATKDWEFFALSVSGAITTITARGNEGVENQFGGNCFDCHAKAAPQWDLICEASHGCDPLQLSDDLILFLQDGDQRCP